MSDETTSPERQRLSVTGLAQSRGLELVGWAEDLNTSAWKLSPQERPGLNHWLERPGDFDVLVFWRLDRAVRSMRDLAWLGGWAKDHGKRLLFAEGPGGQTLELNMADAMSEILAMLLAFAAQMEVQAISERTLGAAAYLRSVGRWRGGRTPYGFKPEAGKGGWVLVKDPETAPVLRRIIDDVLAGKLVYNIAEALTEEGIPTPRKREIWNPAAVTKMLRSRTLLGQIHLSGEAVRDESGAEVSYGEGAQIVTPEEWRKLQSKLDRNGIEGIKAHSTSILMKIIFCGQCGSALHFNSSITKGKRYAYYMCKNRACSVKTVPLAACMSVLEDVFTYRLAAAPVLERVYVPGEDHAEELQAAQEALSYLIERAETAPSAARSVWDSRIEARTEEIERLSLLPSKPSGYTYEPTGQTYAEAWEQGDDEARRALLLRSGIKLRVLGDRGAGALAPGQWHVAEGPRSFRVDVPMDVWERVTDSPETGAADVVAWLNAELEQHSDDQAEEDDPS
jgi:DNA invertase Pin-like site-specific DNA recombinase